MKSLTINFLNKHNLTSGIMVYTEYRPQEMEPVIQKFWEANKILEKLRKINARGRKFNFLQGPPYTSGKVHLGTAWNTVLKDMALRYKRSQGFKVWDRNGYDVHGLPTEHKVMAKFNLKTKDDIDQFGVGKFVQECISFSQQMREQMTKDFLRLGVTLDYADSYLALKEDYIEGEWWLIKKAWKNKRLYLGEKVMTWCANCETAVAKHECEYKNLEEESIFLKFPIKDAQKQASGTRRDSFPFCAEGHGPSCTTSGGRKREFLIIWTTTPWTIAFNLGIMVNPELVYVRAKVGNEVWIVGKGLVGPLIQSVVGKAFTILEEFKGEELEGLEYVHPWHKEIAKYEELKKKHKKVHTVLLSDKYVDFSAGSGLVHCAPGCGPEDQEVGAEYNIPPFNSLNERGEFNEETGKLFMGLVAKKDDHKFIEALDKAGALLATTKVEHDYPTCWRCHLPVIFRKTKQWFFKIEDLREAMIKENAKVNWVPSAPSFDSWTANLKDNSITRQRYWGTPVPLWKCSQEKCGNIEVIGSIAELKKAAKTIPENLHRPWIDTVEWKCKKCKSGMMKRNEDILDVWIDAGTASWNCLYYPQRKEHFKEMFPADLILEATEQVRLWFSMLSICSQLAFGKNCYKNVYMHGMIRDIEGVKMSKSLGNIITPDEMIEKHGADVLRYYLCQTNAGQDLRFSWEEAALKSRQLHILWNVHKFLINLCKESGINPPGIKASLTENILGSEEKYIFSRLNSTIKTVTELFEQYRFDQTIAPLEELFLELSRSYIQMVRDKSSFGEPEDKEVVIYTVFKVLMEELKMFSMICPFISEAIYQNFREEFKLKKESITHHTFPKAEEKRIDLKLETEMGLAEHIVQAALNAREKAGLGLRWPVKELVIVTKNEEVQSTVENLKELIQKQANAKSLSLRPGLQGISTKISSDAGRIGKAYGRLTPQIVTRLAIDSPETILGHLEKESTYAFSLETGEEVKVTKDMIKVERTIPKLYAEGEFKFGQVYVNTERSDLLETEGYVREISRNVQQLRKKSGLEKTDFILLFLKTSGEMRKRLEKFKEELEEKVGAKKIEISFIEPVKKHQFSEEFKVKTEKFAVWMDKV